MSGPALLGVERSARDRVWLSASGPPERTQAFSRAFDLPEAVAAVLAARVEDEGAAELFLSPRLRDSLPDPSHLLDMDRAADRVAAALKSGEQIAILADYDVDGATSGALLRRLLRAYGAHPLIHVPDRETEGYGPNPAAMRRLRDEGAGLVITVDCGATAFEAIEAANAVGLDVVVLDHHMGAAETPAAFAVVNPNRADETSPHRQLAAVGVAFLFAVALRRRMPDAAPDLMAYLDLVALGTVADVAQLTGVNRALVAQGLKAMAASRHVGLAALLSAGGVAGAPEARHLGFVLGPRINAGGRIGESRLGLELLSTDDPDTAEQIARKLDDLNRERQEIERAVFDAALPDAEAQAADGQPVIAVSGEGWRQGVVGIVASRLAERFGRPALVAAIEAGIAVGSGRSVVGAALGPAVIAAKEAGLLLAGGGHAMAAGFRVAADGFAAFAAQISEDLAPALAAGQGRKSLAIDGVVGPAGALGVAEAMARLAPFGEGNPEPRFAIPALRLKHLDVLKDIHLRLRLEGADGARLTAMAFRSADRPLGAFLLGARGGVVHLAGRVEIDTWRGAGEARLIVEDAAHAE